MELIRKFNKESNNLILITLVAIGLRPIMQLLISFDLRSSLVGYVLNNNSKNSRNYQKWSQVQKLSKSKKKNNIFLKLPKFDVTVLPLNIGSYTSPRKTPSRNYISPKNTWPKLHYPEYTFPWTCIFQKLHFPEHTVARNYIFLNVHFPEITLSWTCTCQKLH